MVALDRWADSMASWRRVTIDPARCLPMISPRSRCDECVGICPEGAITLGGGSVAVRDCSACGLCAATCRADAIGLDDPSDEQLVQRFATLGRRSARLSLTCMAGPEGVPRVGCLGRLTPELLLAGAACGFMEIELVTGPCAACRYHIGRTMILEATGTAVAVLSQLNHPCRIEVVDAPAGEPKAAQPSGSTVAAPVYEERRAFLLSAFGLLRELLPVVPSQPANTRPTVPSLSRRRETMRWALAQVKDGRPLHRPWGHAGLRLTGRCFHCGICQRLCPNSAIESDGALTLHPGRCHACGLCTQVCPVGALSLAAPYSLELITVGDPVPLGDAASYPCDRCGEAVTATGDGEPLCLACRVRSSHQEVICL